MSSRVLGRVDFVLAVNCGIFPAGQGTLDPSGDARLAAVLRIVWD